MPQLPIFKAGQIANFGWGTGPYMDGVLYDFSFAEPDAALRRKKLGAKKCRTTTGHDNQTGHSNAKNEQNKLHLITAIERRAKRLNENRCATAQ